MRIIYRDIVGAFIFSNDGKILLGKSNRGTYEGCWIVPGGGIDAGESKEEAIIREVKEEVGLDIVKSQLELIPGDLSGDSRKTLKTGEKVLGKYRFYNFNIKINKKSFDIELKEDDDFEDATWYNIKDLKSLKLPPPSTKTLQKIGIL